MPTIQSYSSILYSAVQAARAAAKILRAECALPGGPRGSDGHSPADDEAEQLIRRRLLETCPSWGFRGEETGYQPPAGGETHVWLVDPNDGTEAMLEGFRGHAVSIAALRDGLPVLGVVYAVDAPDDAGDLFAWAESCGPIKRNGVPLPLRAWTGTIEQDSIVFVSHAADRHPYGNLKCIEPARFRDVPSIAYRLALAAVEGVAAVSLNGPVGHDYAAGHALLRGAGGRLVDQEGKEVRYRADGLSHASYCFGGDPQVVQELARRSWGRVRGSGYGVAAPPPDLAPLRLEPGRLIHDTPALRRAQGCLLGQIAGDALGALVEFQSAQAIARTYSDGGPEQLAAGGPHNIMAGQPTDDSELALLLARSLVRTGSFDADDVAALYATWFHGWLHADGTHSCAHPGCRPFDVGGTTSQALRPVKPEDIKEHKSAAVCRAAAGTGSQANGALMRVSPLGIWGWQHSPSEVDDAARADASLTHRHPVCRAASGIFAATIAHAVAHGGTPLEVYGWALDWARERQVPEAVMSVLEKAGTQPPADYMEHQGWVLVALQNAFYQLVNAPNATEGVIRSVRSGGDTDTNGAIAGALLGAVCGREAWPQQWRAMVLSCRPLYEVTPTKQPRPAAVWPSDALQLAERLLLAGHVVSAEPGSTSRREDIETEDAGERSGEENDRIFRNVLLMVGELHKRGYGRLRISPGMSPSGMHWRCSVAPVDNIGKHHGATIAELDRNAAHYSSSQGDEYFGWNDASHSDPADLADKFIERFPEICEAGKGEDEQYTEWYRSMLHVTEPNALPIAYADWDLERDRLTLVKGGDTFWMQLPPPAEARR